MSYYSAAGEVNYGKIAVTGEIQFGINYNPKTSNLEVTIRRCKDLATADTKKNRSDPLVLLLTTIATIANSNSNDDYKYSNLIVIKMIIQIMIITIIDINIIVWNNSPKL